MDNNSAVHEFDFISSIDSPSTTYTHEQILVQDEKLKYQKELAELSFHEYKSFSNANNNLQTINNSLDNLSLHLNNLVSNLPNIQNSCNPFLQELKQFTQQNNKINIILENHNNLLEIMEIPKLMDACVRNGLYSEAMDLSVHVTRLISKYPSISLIQQIDNDVKNTMQLMLTKLIKLLSKPIKLPVCLKIIGYLRRMDIFDEAELHLVFLLSRDAYLQSLIHELDKEKKDPVFYLKKYIDVFREHFFDIVTQYRAIFSEDSNGGGGGSYPTTPFYSSSFSIPPTPSTPWVLSSSPYLTNTLPEKYFIKKGIMAAANITTTTISDYTVYILEQLTFVLDEFTAQIYDTSSLSSILTQLMYCGMSFGRVGIDFRHLVSGYFESAVDKIIRKMIFEGTQDFLDDLNQAIKNVDLPSLWMISDKKFTSLSVILLDYPPIAHLTNSYLSAFNSLRLVAPISLFKPLGEFINQNLLSIAKLLRDYGYLLVEHKHDTTILQGFNATFAQSFVPFITRCLCDGVYGGLLIGNNDNGCGNYEENLDNETQGIVEQFNVTSSEKNT
ncbi:14131_t:CDS:2 [Entrophospora sp. SA101]|nr:14131_t:CDS:2 [Entrophospora sp. SA101]